MSPVSTKPNAISRKNRKTQEQFGENVPSCKLKHTPDVSNGKEGLQVMTLQGLHGLYTATGIYIQGSVG